MFSFNRDNKDSYLTTARVEGMMCQMCETHVSEAVRRAFPDARKIKSSRKKSEVSFVTDTEINKELLEKAIKDTGYDFISCSTTCGA